MIILILKQNVTSWPIQKFMQNLTFLLFTKFLKERFLQM